MPIVAHQIIGATRDGAIDKLVVIRVGFNKLPPVKYLLLMHVGECYKHFADIVCHQDIGLLGDDFRVFAQVSLLISNSKRLFSKLSKINRYGGFVGMETNGTNHDYSYRLRVGDYRIFFEFEGNEARIISIEEVRKRDERTY